MYQNKPKKNDKHLYGLIIGLVAPIIVMYFVFIMRFNGKISPTDFFLKIKQLNVLPALLSLCALVNLGVFFLMYKFWYNNAARGIIIATFVVAFIVLVLKIDTL
jgi:predicted lysophospholipase L1 biosynthesis ABC-type transport system permease subunit